MPEKLPSPTALPDCPPPPDVTVTVEGEIGGWDAFGLWAQRNDPTFMRVAKMAKWRSEGDYLAMLCWVLSKSLYHYRGAVKGTGVDGLLDKLNAIGEELRQTKADYEEVLASHRGLVRQLDVLLNGEAGAAKQASLCDLVAQVQNEGITSAFRQ